MKIDIVSVQPRMFEGFLRESIVARAQRKGACEIFIHDLRDFAHDKRRTVDDRPYGGGPGMLMMCAPWFEAVETLTKDCAKKPRIIMTTPAGQRFKQSGMIWSLKGAKALLPLRTLHKSNRLDEFFSHLVKDLPQVDCAA